MVSEETHVTRRTAPHLEVVRPTLGFPPVLPRVTKPDTKLLPSFVTVIVLFLVVTVELTEVRMLVETLAVRVTTVVATLPIEGVTAVPMVQ